MSRGRSEIDVEFSKEKHVEFNYKPNLKQKLWSVSGAYPGAYQSTDIRKNQDFTDNKDEQTILSYFFIIIIFLV